MAATIPEEAAVGDSDYAVMTRIRVGHSWIWTTWMRFETYAEAAAHRREGDKVVRFRSPEWRALRRQEKGARPILIKRAANLPPRGEGETLLEFVLRFMSAYGFNQDAEYGLDAKRGSIYPVDARAIESQKVSRFISESDEQVSVANTTSEIADLG